MPIQNLNEVRAGINYVLSEYALGYVHPERVGSYLFPLVPVTLRSGQIIQFGRESFRRYSSRRAPGAKYVEVDFGYSGVPFSLYQEALSIPIPVEHQEEAQGALGLDLGRTATANLMEMLTLTHELDCAGIAQNQALYPVANRTTLVGTAKFSDPTSNPFIVVDAGKNAVRQRIGRRPNLIVCGPQAFVATKNNPAVVNRFSAKDSANPTINSQMLAQAFEVERFVVGDSIWTDGAGNNLDVWGNNMILAYVPDETLPSPARYAPSGTVTRERPSYGYTYALSSGPEIRDAYWDETRDSWIHKGKFEHTPALTSAEAGYLIQGVA